MLSQFEANATLAVRDITKAPAFYEGVLGLERDAMQEEGTLRYRAGSTVVFVYPSEFAGTNRATAVTWVVDDVDAIVRALAAKGATFEHYDMPQMHREGDVHVAGRMRAAWLKDPDGNIIAIVGHA
jgi:catechol 2,3-dioxygenase-like lactoylglutathione lyase family enzyme